MHVVRLSIPPQHLFRMESINEHADTFTLTKYYRFWKKIIFFCFILLDIRCSIFAWRLTLNASKGDKELQYPKFLIINDDPDYFQLNPTIKSHSKFSLNALLMILLLILVEL